MKGKLLLVLLVAAVVVSVYFTYQRSFVWGNFELINSEEESEESLPEEEAEEPPEEGSEEVLEDA